jgi:hypothetical protein
MAVGSVGKRKAERRDCCVKAQVQLPGRPAIDCVIINFSATGARARLLTETELPARFKLYIPSRPETKASLLRWRNGLEFGCEYSTGVADENAFFALVDRVDSIEAALGATHAAPVTMAAPEHDNRLDGVEARLGAGGGSPEALSALVARLTKLETQIADAPATVDAGLEQRIARLERGVVAAPQEASTIDFTAIEKTIEARIADGFSRRARIVDAAVDARVGALEQKLALATEAPTQLFDMQDVEDAIQARLATITPPEAHPEVVERLIKIETELANRPELVFESGAPQLISRPLPDPALLKRIADVEAKVMTLGRAAAAVDFSPIERRIDKTDKNAQEYAARVERFLSTRIEDLELHFIAAPTPSTTREVDASDLERKLLELTQRFDRQHSLDAVERFSDRISNVEMSLLDLRGAPAPEDDDLRQRIARLEERNGEVLAALRNVLALLTVRSEQRAAS